MAHDGSGENSEVAPPVTATGQVTEGAMEIRDVRLAVELRGNKEHAHLETGTKVEDDLGVTGGGEHLEGSARIHTATSAPANIVVGAVDSEDAANDITITGHEALAEGLMWAKTNGAYVLQVYAASGWHDVEYLPLAGGTVAGTTEFSGQTTVSGAGIFTGGVTISDADGTAATVNVAANENIMGIHVNLTSVNAAAVGAYLAASDAATGIAVHLRSDMDAGNALYCQAIGLQDIPFKFHADSASTAKQVLDVAADNNNAHFRLTGDPTVASPQDGDLWFDGTSAKLRIATSTEDIATSDGGTGGSASAGAGKQYIKVNIGGTVYKVLHDGTV